MLRLQRAIGNRLTTQTFASLVPPAARAPVVQRLDDGERNALEAFYLVTIREIGDPTARRNRAVYQQALASATLDGAKELIRQHVTSWKDSLAVESDAAPEQDSRLPLGGIRPPNQMRFYMALDERIRMLLATVRFGAAAELFNTAYWEKRPGEPDNLYLREGRTPTDAIEQLHKYSEPAAVSGERETAKLDCVEIIEVARWLAEIDVVGQKLFNQKYGGGTFVLAAPGSTGVTGATLAVRAVGVFDSEYRQGSHPTRGEFEFTSGPRTGEHVELAEYLATLPVGSRVMWRNFDEAFDDNHDFKNENTIKLAADSYAAHPFGIFSLADVARHVGMGGYEDVQALRNDLRNLRKDLLATRERLVAAESRLAESEREGSETEKIKAQVEKIKKKLKKIGKEWKECKDDCGDYADIRNLGQYVMEFVRIVEIETFAPPV